MLRFSLATLFIVLLYASVGCAALVNASGIWPQVAVTMTVTILLMATLATVCWKERSRHFALGFSITGWVYFVLVFTSVVNVRGFLLTDTAVTWLNSMIHGERNSSQYRIVSQTFQTSRGPITTQQAIPARPNPAPRQVTPVLLPPTSSTGRVVTAAYSAPPPPLLSTQVDPFTFSNIGHSLWAVILACAGGIVAQLIYTRSQRSESSETA